VDRSLLERLRNSWVAQPDKQEETPESTLHALYFAAVETPLSVRKAMTMPLPDLDHEASKKLATLVELRCSGIPLAHLTNRQQFMGIELLVGPEALIPRMETELLGYETLSIVRSLQKAGRSATIMDICTGAGNVVLGVMAHEPQCKAYGSDLSSEALELAKKNADNLGLKEKVDFRQGNLFEPFNSEDFWGKVDVVCCNPPYISSNKVATLDPEISQYEPQMAFDGGPYGVSLLMRIIREAPRFLKPESFLCIEVGVGQGEFVTRLLTNLNLYRNIRQVVNDDREVRVLVATCGQFISTEKMANVK
jgi:release factor glutamine methyltransferase